MVLNVNKNTLRLFRRKVIVIQCFLGRKQNRKDGNNF